MSAQQESNGVSDCPSNRPIHLAFAVLAVLIIMFFMGVLDSLRHDEAAAVLTLFKYIAWTSLMGALVGFAQAVRDWRAHKSVVPYAFTGLLFACILAASLVIPTVI